MRVREVNSAWLSNGRGQVATEFLPVNRVADIRHHMQCCSGSFRLSAITRSRNLGGTGL